MRGMEDQNLINALLIESNMCWSEGKIISVKLTSFGLLISLDQ